MTKLEQKLIELGYSYNNYDETTDEKEYIKLLNSDTLYIYYDCYFKTHYGMCIANTRTINQNVINNHQQAFNQLQQDLKELNEYENI